MEGTRDAPAEPQKQSERHPGGRVSNLALRLVRDLAIPIVSIVAVVSSVAVANSSIRAARSQSDHDFLRTQQLTAYSAFLSSFNVISDDINQSAAYRQSTVKADQAQSLGWQQAALKATNTLINAMPNIELVGSDAASRAAYALIRVASSEVGQLQSLKTGKSPNGFLHNFDIQTALALAKFKEVARADVNTP